MKRKEGGLGEVNLCKLNRELIYQKHRKEM